MQPVKPSLTDRLAVFVAEGFGIGRIPIAPGTFGTALGLGWIYLLLLPRSIPLYIGGILVGFFATVWIGAWAERVLQKEDPGSIVLDEITAMPLAFLPAVLLTASNSIICDRRTEKDRAPAKNRLLKCSFYIYYCHRTSAYVDSFYPSSVVASTI